MKPHRIPRAPSSRRRRDPHEASGGIRGEGTNGGGVEGAGIAGGIEGGGGGDGKADLAAHRGEGEEEGGDGAWR